MKTGRPEWDKYCDMVLSNLSFLISPTVMAKDGDGVKDETFEVSIDHTNNRLHLHSSILKVDIPAPTDIKIDILINMLKMSQEFIKTPPR